MRKEISDNTLSGLGALRTSTNHNEARKIWMQAEYRKAQAVTILLRQRVY
ncbi:MAG: hypothetical protein JSV05_04285 [Candidatus Bathyarchaeota archaeon]|nr:MAG: hypothetical protein JSV05_04285 [Candidatus Bathyarchaeota archaeon]